MAKTKKNGKIELLRLFFCLSVVLYHSGGYILGDANVFPPALSLFAHGRSAVEFFFLLSGYLAAKSAYKYRNSQTSIGKDTYTFIYKKAARIFPAHIIACILMVVEMSLYSGTPAKFWNHLGMSIPSWFFIQRTGIETYDIISVEWYIGSMLFALAIIYPLLRKWFDIITYTVAPVLSAMLIGYMLHTYGSMPGYKTWGTYSYACNLRGFAAVLLGVFVYGVSEKIKEKQFSKKQWIWLIIVEDLAWAFSIYFMFSNMDQNVEGIFIYVTALAMAISFARDYKSKFYSSKFVSYLGRISLPIYLCQNFPRSMMYYNRGDLDDNSVIAIVFVEAIVLGILIDLIDQGIAKLKTKKNLTKD